MIAVIKYIDENIESLPGSLDELGIDYKITSSESEILNSDKVIFPGFGIASKVISKLHMTNLFSFLKMCKKPLLGIGLGMQLMAELSTEGGNIPCLGIFPLEVEKFDNENMKAPFKGLNEIEVIKESKLFKGIGQKEKFYFSNSYYLPVNELTTSVAENKIRFSASMERGNYYGLQFHPEKSGKAGLKVLANFLDL